MPLTQTTLEAMTDAEFGQLWALVEAESWRRILQAKPGQRPAGSKKAGATNQKEPRSARQ